MVEINEKVKIHYPLPLKPRSQQLKMLDFTARSINSGRKNIMLNAPTGVGKSYYTIMFINWYLNNVNEEAKFDILTNSKILQTQYLKDFNYIKNLKGKVNYECQPFDTDCEQGMEICKVLKQTCKAEKNGTEKIETCPYLEARRQWLESRIGLTNFHFFTSIALYAREKIFEKRNSKVLIIDEAHDFEAVFSDFISTLLSARQMKRYGFTQSESEDIDQSLIKIKNIQQYAAYLEKYFLPKVQAKVDQFEEEIEQASSKRKKELAKILIYTQGQVNKFSNFLQEYYRDLEPDELTDPKANWVLDINQNPKERMYSGVELRVSPVWVYRYLPQFVWSKYDHIIFMSGTILHKEMFSYINGLEANESSYLDISSPFPVKNRPIYYMKVGKMTYQKKRETFQRQKIKIEKVLKRHEEHKGIIHTATYEFSKWIEETIYNKKLLFHDNKNRDQILEKHIYNKVPSVLVSPSMNTGVDLKDDLSRFQIIMKIPYPNISSNKIKARQRTNRNWYAWKTCVDLIQALGRSVRSETDYAETFILDESFSDILKYNTHLIPRWVTKAVKTLN